MASSSVNLLVPHLSSPVPMTYRPRTFHPLSSILRLPNRIPHLQPLPHFSLTFIDPCFVYLPQPQPLSNQPFGHGGTLMVSNHISLPPLPITFIYSLVNWPQPKQEMSPFPFLRLIGYCLTFRPILTNFPSTMTPMQPFQLLFLLIKYELLHPPSSNVTRTQFSTPSPATWSKCRVAAPKIWAHQGVIKSESGHICTTSSTLDSALRATRSFWQDFPSPYHSHWTELLSFYASRVSPVPHCSPPNFDDFYKAITSSPDSAPGADGLPFAAWRVAPAVSANALASHFNDIQTQQARTPPQSLVFIPKADKGDYADNYRPLGLPNTCDRLIDRAAYSRFATTLIGALHPAQALLNTFREPQANFLTVQHFLNNTQEHGCVLLSDLAKAFERVNPHWIMHVLFHLNVPYWVIIYCRHILFGRQALHKIGAYFRPPIALRTGVDMGRAFSVLLFCIAMDPWYHHVHAIPRVCVNAGYMDDNATGGNGLSWLHAAQTLILKFYSAGFQVLKHSCYKAVPISTPPPYLPYITETTPPTDGYPSLWTAFAAIEAAQYVQLISGTMSVTVPASWIHVSSVLCIPSHPHLLTRLHTTPCSCKCKTFLIPNFPLSHNDLAYLDATPFGTKIVSPSATMLGLYLHSPFSCVLPTPAALPPTLIDALTVESQQTQKACLSMERRLQSCLPLNLSFRDRTLFLSFYVLSLPHYHHSVLLPSDSLINHYVSLIRKSLCPRHWIQAHYLPGIVSFLKLGILHCPTIFLYSSLLGFSVRLYGEVILVWLCGIVSSLPDIPNQLAQGLQQIRKMLQEATPFNPDPFPELLHPYLFQHTPSHRLSKLATKLFKLYLRRKLHIEARTFLISRYANVKFHFSTSPALFDTLHQTPTKVIPPASRLAILRWSIDSEPDVHFRLRRHISRPSPCRCGCGSISSLYPEGLQHGSISSHHLHLPHTWRIFLPPSLPPPFANIAHRPDPPALPPAKTLTWRSRSGADLTSLEGLPASLITWVSHPCVLCGHGDNSVQHWLYFCPVPALAGTLLLRHPWKTSFWFLHHSLSYTQLAQRSALWVSTRQFVHERSGLPPPSLHPPPSHSDTIFHMATQLSQRAISFIPSPFRPTHLHFSPPPSLSASCYHGVTTIRKLFAFQKVYPDIPNCSITYGLCSCGTIHAYLSALAPIPPNTPLHVGDPPYHDSDFILQFDGGAFRTLQVGGAGVVLWQHTRGHLTFVDSLCIPLASCPDAAHAEAAAAAGAVQLAAKHFPRLSPTRIVIKGDNKAVIDFMTNTGKYRRPDLQQSLQEAHHLLAFRLPPCYWCYTPREFNKCADYLAGVARDHARECLASTTSTSEPLELSPFFCPLPPSLSPSFSPPPLLSTPPSSTHFTFPELPSFPPSLYPLLFRTYHTIPRILRYLRTLIRVGPHAHTSLGAQSPLAVSYKPSASDNNGRLYPYPTGAATLPRSLRFLLFGASHLEIDLVSAHYQLFQCAAHTFLDQPLPAAPDLRAALLEDMSRPPCTILTHFPQAPKRTPLLLLNSTLGDTLQYLAAFGYYPSFEVRHMLQRIHSTKGPLLDALERVYGPRQLSTSTTRNRCFFLLERLEASWMKHFVSPLLSLFVPTSLIWLHDGIWVAPVPSELL